MHPDIVAALADVGITRTFAIQELTLPLALDGHDLIGQARTGTGKTLGFGVPLLQRTVAPHDPDHADLAAPDKPQALVVAPTRELALQVSNDLTLAAQGGRQPGVLRQPVEGGQFRVGEHAEQVDDGSTVDRGHGIS